MEFIERKTSDEADWIEPFWEAISESFPILDPTAGLALTLFSKRPKEYPFLFGRDQESLVLGGE
jgi:hypothetical protein